MRSVAVRRAHVLTHAHTRSPLTSTKWGLAHARPNYGDAEGVFTDSAFVHMLRELHQGAQGMEQRSARFV